ncbi:hypothetical protein [Azospirillum argentinense]
MPDMQVEKLDRLLNTAATEGIDKALELHGEVISAREAQALRKLSPQELQEFTRINQKITDAAGLANADWTCGALC